MIRVIVKLEFENGKKKFKIIKSFLYNSESKIFKNRLKISKKLTLLKIKNNLKREFKDSKIIYNFRNDNELYQIQLVNSRFKFIINLFRIIKRVFDFCLSYYLQ